MRYLNDYNPTSKFTLKVMDDRGLVLFAGWYHEAESARVAFSFCQKVDNSVSYGKIVGYHCVETL